MNARRTWLRRSALASTVVLIFFGLNGCKPEPPPSATPPPVMPAEIKPLAAPPAETNPTETKAPDTKPPETLPPPPPQPELKIHPCAGGDRWFPADAEKLGRLVDAYLAGPAPDIGGPPVALVVPHAGYPYSGEVAGKAYVTLRGQFFGRVILLGPSHQAPVEGASVLGVDAYETPLGRIPVDLSARDALLKCPVVQEQPAAHRGEHSVENQLPFLQRVLGPFKMVEVLVGDLSPESRTALADAIRTLIDGRTLLVISSDFTHYGPGYGYVPFRDNVPENLKRLNDRAIQEMLQVDVPGWDATLAETRDTICGQAAIGVLLKILEPWGNVRGARVAFDTSGRITGDWSHCVTYAAVAFWRAEGGLTKAEQTTLLRLARDTVAAFVKTGRQPESDPAAYQLTETLKAPGAAFVTLKNAGRLRGCIGHIIAAGPLYKSIIENACHACRDPRFTYEPITEEEVPALSIEISVLTPMRRVTDPKEIEVGRDGLMMERGWARGLLLPQVPTEQGWNREEFLAATCQKAGLPPEAWKDPGTTIYRFSAQVFGEGEAKAQ